MNIEVENHKGIEFVRISSLPEDQKKFFWKSFDGQRIIQILREDELLNDCLRKGDYWDWYNHKFQARMVVNAISMTREKTKAGFLKRLISAAIQLLRPSKPKTEDPSSHLKSV